MVVERRVLHIDMDAFFASVEVVLNPALKGKPVIVGGDSQTRGVVCTASYEARKFGVHSAMPIAKARRLCPHGIFLRGNFQDYMEASEKIFSILSSVSPCVEPTSVDEGYVDVSGSQRLFGGDDAIGAYVKERVHEETGLPCTVAIAPNKLVSKIAVGEAKPDGYLCIKNGEEASFLKPLPVGRIPGVGPRTCDALESFGILTIGTIADMALDDLLNIFGQTGYVLHQSALGISTSPVKPRGLPKSISRETTFERDLLDWNRIECYLAYLAEKALCALRQNDMETRRVTLKVRYSDFETCTFAQTFAEPTCVDSDINNALKQLLPKAKNRRSRVRLVGVTLSWLTYNQHQLNFLRESAEKWGRALNSVDDIRTRYGFESLRFAKAMELGRKPRFATPSLSR